MPDRKLREVSVWLLALVSAKDTVPMRTVLAPVGELSNVEREISFTLDESSLSCTV